MSQIGSEVYVLAGATLATSIGLTLAMRKFALSRGLLDVPNERSSHKVPTPRGGGAAITLTAMTGFAALAVLHRLDFAVFAALAGGLAVAAVGFVDDRHALPAVVGWAACVARRRPFDLARRPRYGRQCAGYRLGAQSFQLYGRHRWLGGHRSDVRRVVRGPAYSCGVGIERRGRGGPDLRRQLPRISALELAACPDIHGSRGQAAIWVM